MPIKALFAACLLAAAPLMAHASDAREQLRQFIDQVHSATGDFVQQTADGKTAKKAPQSGRFAFQRPGKFKWEVREPYDQLIVSDGSVLYQYDPDLQQVTERSVDQSIGTSPAAVLFGSGSLDQAFELSPLPDSGGLQWLQAKPRSSDAGFRQMDIGLAENLPRQLRIHDAFGQTTLIELNHLVPNASLPADTFRFSPPADADVVKM